MYMRLTHCRESGAFLFIGLYINVVLQLSARSGFRKNFPRRMQHAAHNIGTAYGAVGAAFLVLVLFLAPDLVFRF